MQIYKLCVTAEKNTEMRRERDREQFFFVLSRLPVDYSKNSTSDRAAAPAFISKNKAHDDGIKYLLQDHVYF